MRLQPQVARALLPWLAALGCGVLQPLPLHGQTRTVAVRMLDGSNNALDAGRDALGVARMVTNNGTLPQGFAPAATSPERRDLRIEVRDADAAADEVFVTLSSIDGRSGKERSRQRVRARRTQASGVTFRSPFIRLVADRVDETAPGVEGRTLRVALRDSVVARYEHASGAAETRLRVGRPGAESHPDAARLARLHVHVLRGSVGGAPVLGDDATSALALMRDQIRAANEIWLQCGVTFGAPEEAAIEIVDPPVASLLSVGDGDGLPATGGGDVLFVADGRPVGPVRTQTFASTEQTARAIAEALRVLGLVPEISINPQTRFGAAASTDVLVRRRSGALAELGVVPNHPLTTDVRQSVTIGRVDLSDGVLEFDNMTARAGTLEERAIVKALRDDDPSTIDIFVVNRFTQGTRQGEAFIAQGRGAIVNTVILDRQGLRHLPLAWTLAHEVGHVLLDDPLHPDNIGPDRPWLLMDADSTRGTVNGPKRLRAQDCARVRQTARSAKAPLLVPYDAHSTAIASDDMGGGVVRKEH